MRRWDRITVIAPHLDDECWCGALLARTLLRQPDAVITILWLSTHGYRQVDDAEIMAESVKSLEVLQAIPGVNRAQVAGIRAHMEPYVFSATKVREYLYGTLPMGSDLILIPSSADYHQDHQCVHDEAVRVLRRRDVEVLGYLVPQNGIPRRTHPAQISEENLKVKQAMIDCYQSQVWRGRVEAGSEERYEAIQLAL